MVITTNQYFNIISYILFFVSDYLMLHWEKKILRLNKKLLNLNKKKYSLGQPMKNVFKKFVEVNIDIKHLYKYWNSILNGWKYVFDKKYISIKICM
jgi:hypothetical protein